MKNRVLKSTLFLAGCLIAGTLFGVYTSKYYLGEANKAPQIDGLLWPGPKTIGPFTMVNQKNTTFDQENLAGKWTFLFFGYTHCPDVCPITLSVMDHVYRQLRENRQAANIQMVFVSVDPGRDTPDKMASYMDYFNKDFTGLTGTEEQLMSLTRQMGIVYAYGDETAPGEYLVDHTASIFLVSPEKKWVGIFSSPHDAQSITNRFQAIRDFISGQSG